VERPRFLLTAYQDGAASITMRGFITPHLDAAGIDCQAVLERRLIEVPMDRTEKGEVGTASCHGKQASAG
jgi:hypothetical protein